MTWQFSKGLLGQPDILFGDSTTTATQTRRSTGASVATPIQYIDTAVIPLSTAAKTTLGLAGTQYIDAAWAGLASGASISKANLAVYGLIRTSITTTTPQALDVADPVYGYIPSSAQKTALGLVTSQSISLPHTASTANGYATANQVRDEHAAAWGTGKDGAFKTGTITDPAAAPSALSTSTTGGFIPADAGGYTYKVTFGNATGETLPSSASAAQITTGSTSTISMTIPVGGANCAWRKIYRDEGSSSWKLVGYIPDNTTTSWTDTQQYVSSTTAPGANTADTSWDAPAGEYHFDGDMTWPAVTLGGDITVRCRGIVTISGAITGTGLGGGKSVLTPYSPFAGVAQTIVYPSSTIVGFGAKYQVANYPGAGSTGQAYTGGTGGTAGLPGATICIYAHAIRFAANITSIGAVGGAGAGTAGGGGGAGAGGIVWCVARDAITSGTHTVNVTGGAGGAAASSGGASTAYGGYGGGGGLFFASAPILELSGLTVTKAAGAAGANSATANGTAPGGHGGNCAGDGGAYTSISGNSCYPERAATAGQSVTTTQFVMGGLR